MSEISKGDVRNQNQKSNRNESVSLKKYRWKVPKPKWCKKKKKQKRIPKNRETNSKGVECVSLKFQKGRENSAEEIFEVIIEKNFTKFMVDTIQRPRKLRE